MVAVRGVAGLVVDRGEAKNQKPRSANVRALQRRQSQVFACAVIFLFHGPTSLATLDRTNKVG